MGDQTLLSAFVSSLHSNLFLREFSFARTCFTPPGYTEVELADHLVRVGDLLFLYQLKERDAGATGAVEVWIRNKVVKKATRQIRSTIGLLRSGDPVRLPNERGHVFDLSAQPNDARHSIVSADAISPNITELKSPRNTDPQCPFTDHSDGGGTDAAKGGRHGDSDTGGTGTVSLRHC